MTVLRPARPEDAAGMVEVQNAIHRAGLRASPVELAQVRERYLAPDASVACTVVDRDGRIAGFQSLTRALPGNPYALPEGWGIMGTHIHPDAGRQGFGRRLFAVSLTAARAAGLRHIDASIGADNTDAVAYYRSVGFTPYLQRGDAVAHRIEV